MARMVIDTEQQQRTMLRLSLEPGQRPEGTFLRQGRVIGWLEDALAPLSQRVPKAELRRLVLAIRATIGIEALVWLTDVARLSRKEAIKTMRWSAQSLLQATLAQAAER
jgi:hypothetical protein